MGRTKMSKRELGRVEVLARVRSKQLRVVDAGRLLQVSYRQAKRLWKRYREEGATGLQHRSAGRPSNHGHAKKFRQKVLGLVREKYGGEVGERFGPTLAAEHLAAEDGLHYGENFKYGDAVREARLAIDEEPDNALAWDLLGWALAYETPPDAVEAEKAVREAIRLNPSIAYTQYHLGRALFLQGRFPEAMAAFDRCEELSGNSSGADFGRSQALAAQGRYAEAITVILKRGAPKSMIDTYFLSSFYAGNGEKEKALATLQKALDMGFRDSAAIKANPDFASLRADPSFQRIVGSFAK